MAHYSEIEWNKFFHLFASNQVSVRKMYRKAWILFKVTLIWKHLRRLTDVIRDWKTIYWLEGIFRDSNDFASDSDNFSDFPNDCKSSFEFAWLKPLM